MSSMVISEPSIAAPSAAESTSSSSLPPQRAPQSTRPNPAREAHNAKMSKFDYEIENIRSKLNDLTARITQLTAGPEGSAPASTSVFTQVKEKRQQHAALMDSRKASKERMVQLRDEVARKTRLLQDAQANERQIIEIERTLTQGNLKIPDERRMLCEISKLRRAQQPFSALQAEVQKLQAELEAVSATFNAASAQLDTVRKERDGLQESVKVLDSQKQDKQAAVQALWEEKKKLKERIDALYAEKKALHENFKAAAAQHRIALERERQKREVGAKKGKVEDEIEVLEEKIAKLDLGVDHELENCDGLISALEVMFPVEKAEVEVEKQQQPKSGRRIVAGADLVPLASKGAKGDFMAECCSSGALPAKSGKKSKGSGAGGSFKLPIHIVAGLSALGFAIPLSAAAVPGLLEEIRAKRAKIVGSSEVRRAAVQVKKAAIEEQIAGLRQQIVEIERQALGGEAEKEAE